MAVAVVDRPWRVMRSLVAFLVPAMAAITLLLLAGPGDSRAARNRATRLIGRWGAALAGLRIQVHDPRALRYTRPAVFIFNHQSSLDPMLLCRLLEHDVTGVAKRQLYHHPVLGPLLRLAGAIFVDRDAGTGSQQLAPAARVLKQGMAVAVSPEGHRSTRLGRFRPGALRLARQAEVAIIPVVIHGSGQCMPPGRMLIKPGDIIIEVLEPVDAETTTPQALENLYRHHLAAAANAGTRRRT
jgi:putative phosphoserine phosphatase/1-acylglycerol-3-phosphate O-acyltransferase